jgi:DnaJ-class molecular chaperone
MSRTQEIARLKRQADICHRNNLFRAEALFLQELTELECSAEEPCPSCGGSGEYEGGWGLGEFGVTRWRPCKVCEGTGFVAEEAD